MVLSWSIESRSILIKDMTHGRERGEMKGREREETKRRESGEEEKGKEEEEGEKRKRGRGRGRGREGRITGGRGVAGGSCQNTVC